MALMRSCSVQEVVEIGATSDAWRELLVIVSMFIGGMCISTEYRTDQHVLLIHDCRGELSIQDDIKIKLRVPDTYFQSGRHSGIASCSVISDGSIVVQSYPSKTTYNSQLWVPNAIVPFRLVFCSRLVQSQPSHLISQPAKATSIANATCCQNVVDWNYHAAGELHRFRASSQKWSATCVYSIHVS